jgi:hypothetical protein
MAKFSNLSDQLAVLRFFYFQPARGWNLSGVMLEPMNGGVAPFIENVCSGSLPVSSARPEGSAA